MLPYSVVQNVKKKAKESVDDFGNEVSLSYF